jgi:hypothetical protein
LCIEELHNLFSSPNIIRMVKSRTFSWTGRIAYAVENRIHAEPCMESKRKETA